jgi:hypothetical protein
MKAGSYVHVRLFARFEQSTGWDELQELVGTFPKGMLVKLLGLCGSSKGLRSVLSMAASLHFLPAAAGIRQE